MQTGLQQEVFELSRKNKWQLQRIRRLLLSKQRRHLSLCQIYAKVFRQRLTLSLVMAKKKCTSVDPKRMKIWMQHPPRRMALSNRGVKAAGTTINLLMKLRLIGDVRCWQIICTRLCLVLL